jgi:hypothetical protein
MANEGDYMIFVFGMMAGAVVTVVVIALLAANGDDR